MHLNLDRVKKCVFKDRFSGIGGPRIEYLRYLRRDDMGAAMLLLLGILVVIT